MTPEEIADEARNAISDYCINTCKALCCRKGVLMLSSQDEVDAVTQGAEKELREQGLLCDKNGSVALEVGKKQCPSLTADFKCGIYTNPHRPKGCHQFPLYLIGKNAIASPMCPAVNEGKFDAALKKLSEIGFKVL